MNIPQAAKTVRRSDWRSALGWASRNRGNAAFLAILFVAAGLCSALGLLRWQEGYMRWSFAALCWVLAVIVAARAPWRGKVVGADKTRSDEENP